MTCLLRNKENEALLNEYEGILGSREAAYYALSQNNGYPLDKDLNGKDSALYKDLLQRNGGSREKAILEKATIFTSKFIEDHYDWTQDRVEPTIDDLDNYNGALQFDAKSFSSMAQNYGSRKDNFILAQQQEGKTLREATEAWNQAEYERLHTTLADRLEKSFGLIKSVDKEGNILLSSKDLQIQFVDYIRSTSLKDVAKASGQYISNKLSAIGNVIKVAFGRSSAKLNTESHEICHHYLNMFQNSQMVQKALSDIMSQYKIKNITEAEEKLVDILVGKANDIAERTKAADVWEQFNTQVRDAFKDLVIDDSNKEMLHEYLAQSFLLNIDINQVKVSAEFNKVKLENKAKFQLMADNTLSKDEAIQRLQDLFDTYDHIVSKTPSQIKIQDKLFQTMQKMQRQSDDDAICTFVNYVVDRIGYMDQNGNITDGSIYKFLENSRKNNFKGITAQQLIDIDKNSIGFFKEVLNQINSAKVFGNFPTILKTHIDQINASMQDISVLYRNALHALTTGIVDQYIDDNMGLGNIENAKIVAEDWLLRQAMYGDINWLEMWAGMYGRSSSPILRILYNKVNDIDYDRQVFVNNIGHQIDALRRNAWKAMSKLVPGNPEMVLMEFNKDGKATGNFRTEYNQGQYEQDRREEQQRLMEKYGYEQDEDTGELIDKQTGCSVYQEKWKYTPAGWQKPKYYKYLDEMDAFDDGRRIKQYTRKYYQEMRSAPIYYPKTKNDPIPANPHGHGLSPDTIREKQRIDEDLRYYAKQATRKDGTVHYEDLSPEQQKAYLLAKEEAEQLSNPFYPNGEKKEDDKYRMAIELRSFNQWVSDQTDYDQDDAAFIQELNAITDPVKRDQFIRLNSTVAINPLLYKLANVGQSQYNDPVLKYLQSGLLTLTKDNRSISKDFSRLPHDSEAFFANAQQIEQDIEDSGKNGTKSDFRKYFTYRLAMQPGLNKSKLDFFRDKYLDRAKNGELNQFFGQDITTFSDSDLRYLIDHRFFFKNTKKGPQPLDCFYEITPKSSTFVYNGYTYNSIILKPTGRFSKRSNATPSKIYDDRYDFQRKEPGYQLTDKYKDKYFDQEINQNSDIRALYDMLTSTMKQMYEKIPAIKSGYNNALPQIEGTTAMLLSRVVKGPNSAKDTFGYICKSMVSIMPSDTDVEVKGSKQRVTPSGEDESTVPIRFVKRLDNPEYISSSICSNVIQFVDMAKNYEGKMELLPEILAIQKQLNPEYREDKYKSSRSGNVYKHFRKMDKYSSQRSEEAINTLLETQFYGKNVVSGLTKNNEKSDTARALISRAKRYGSIHMLGLNTASMTVGALDANLQIFKDSLVGKYLTMKDFGWAIIKLLSPKTIMNNFRGLGKSQPTTKEGALMQMNQISKNNSEIFEGLHKGWFRRFCLKYLMMGGYTLGDYMNNSIVMMSFYHHTRLFEDTSYAGVKPGFYTRNQLIKAFTDAGYTKKQAKAVYSDLHTTLYDAYDWEPGDYLPTVNKAFAKYLNNKIAKNVKNKIAQRTAFYNGVMPATEVSKARQNLYTAMMFMMRNFIVGNIYERMQNANDYIVKELDENGIPVKNPKTAEEAQSYGYYNYETGEIERGHYTSIANLVRRYVTNWVYGLRSLLSNDQAKKQEYEEKREKLKGITQLEIEGVKAVSADIAICAAATLGSIFLKMKADEDKSWWIQYLYLVSLRLAEARGTNLDPTTVADFVGSITTLQSVWNDFGTGFTYMLDAMGLTGHNPTDTVKSGAYKGSSRWFRDMMKMIPFSNLYEDANYNTLRAKQNYYRNKYWYLHLFGNDSTGSSSGEPVMPDDYNNDNDSFGEESFDAGQDFGGGSFDAGGSFQP